ncbi:coiled-coil domain-containing protein 73 [Petaurus breviceps papuanus]|uniref:coiled-coil domain-containing protein 73 n=1 Tax=Petaurus breviceps papuanus TaxID=3040969 RepID=UPI0036DBBF5D
MDKDFKTESTSYSLQSASEPLFSIQILEFKTSLLEALEELRMRREAEIQYEEQIRKIIVEKQELQWQKENLQHQKETLTKQHKEAMALFKKQLQTRMCAMEEEKGQYQLASEIKEKEMEGLKETLKGLQVSKYSLQKKVNEMEQKLQLHLLAKEDHHKQLSEIEKYYATITCQFGMVKESHGKLEQNVHEAIQLNKRLSAANKKLESEVCSLKQELKKVTTDLIKSKIICQTKAEGEDINLKIKEQQFQELQEKLQMEIEIRKKVSEKLTYIQEEKQGIISSFEHIQQLLQRQTQNNIRMEAELKALKDSNQTLERDNELQRKKVKENEEKFFNLQNKHDKARGTWEKHEKKLIKEIDEIKNELMSVKEAHLKLQESCNEVSSQKNVFFEQDNKLQKGKGEKEKGNEISTEQNQSESIEITTIQKWNSQQEITAVNIVNFCSNTEYILVGKNNQGQERNSEELQFFENNEKKETYPTKKRKTEELPEEKLVKTSQSKAFNPDKDLLQQGQTWRVCTADLRNTEAVQTKDKMCLERGFGCVEFQTLNNPYSRTEISGETGRILQDRTQEFTLSSVDEASETGHSKSVQEKLPDTSHDISNVQCDEDVSGSEILKQEFRMNLGMEENSINEEIPDNGLKEAELTRSLIAKDNSIDCLKDNSRDSSYCVSDYKECKSNQTHSSYKRGCNGLQHEQTCSYAQETHDTLGKMDSNSTCGIAINPISLATSNDNRKVYCESPKKSFNMMPISGKATPSLREIVCWENLNEIQSHQAKQDGPKQVESDENMTVCLFQVNLQNIDVSQAKDRETVFQKPSVTGTSLSSKESQVNDTEMSEAKDKSITKNDLFLVRHAKAQQHTLLNSTREKTDSLSNTVSERKYVEGQLEESCSFHIKPSGDLVNRSGRSAFDLSTADKETEKTLVHLDFFDPCPWSKVNQVESQTMNTWASKVPLLLKERLVGSSENKKIPSKILCQNLDLDAVMREITMDTTSINREADTWTNSRIQPSPKRDPREEWNAIAKTFYDSPFPTEHDRPQLLSAGLLPQPFQAVQSKDTADFTDCSLGEEEEDWQSQDILIKNQINEIEKFLNLEKSKETRKRESEEMLD